MGKRGRKPQPRKTRECAGCGEIIVIDPKRNHSAKFCSHACYAKKQEERNGGHLKRKCAACHAAMGMTGAASGRLLNLPKSSIARIRKEDGLRRLNNREARVREQIQAHGIIPWWGGVHEGEAWMRGYNPRFPDWANHPLVRTEYANKWTTQRYHADMDFRIRHNLRCDIRSRLKRNDGRKAAKTESLLGCSVQEFRKRLQKSFTKGMTWENYGTAWEIDHIVPASWFDLTKPEHQHRCWHYSNLRPLSKAKNRKRGNRAHPQLLMTHLADFTKH